MNTILRKTALCIFTAIIFGNVQAQELYLGADFTTLFDNKEYATMEFNDSWTLFSARLTPKIGMKWAERNELILGLDMVQDFGSDSKILSDINIQLYYGYSSPRLRLIAGIFPREEMRGLSSQLFFDREYRYYHNRINGILARYEGKNKEYSRNSFIEFAFDYTGIRDKNTREAFMIISAGEYATHGLRIGYDIMVGHYAKDDNPETAEGVVDNILAVPHIGYDISAGKFGIELQLSYIQSLQRDRYYENVWLSPKGGEFYCSISRWGVTISNSIYMGENLLPHYNRYGSSLYHGSPFYQSTEKIYDAITASYENSFFSNTLNVGAGITMEYNGTGWGTRQWLQLKINLDYGILLRRRQNN